MSDFQFAASEHTDPGATWGGLFLKPGDPVQISLGGVQVINGYVVKRSVAYDRESHDLVIQGKSRTCDVADSSVVIKPGTYAGNNFQQIANGVMQPHGVKVTMQNPPAGWDTPYKFATPQYGETCLAFLSRLANLRGLFLCDDANGNLTAGQGNPSAPNAAQLQEGKNILSAVGVLDDENAWSTTGMIAQFPANDDTWKQARAATATVTNNTTRPNRVRLVHADTPASSQELVTRTNFENAITGSTLITADITVQGWFKPDGTLWQPTDNISILSPMLFPMVEGPVKLAVKSVTYAQSAEAGTTTTLQIVDPQHLTTLIDPSTSTSQANPTHPLTTLPSTDEANMFLGDDTSYRSYLTLVRGKVVAANDAPLMQTVDIRGLQNELIQGVERFQSYGRSVVPVAPDDAAGSSAPEFVAGFIAGDRSHPIVMAMDDRRYRPKNGKPGQIDDYHYKGNGCTWGDTGWAYTGGAANLQASWTVGDLTVTWADGKALVQVGGTHGPAVVVNKTGTFLGGDPDVLGMGAFDFVMTASGPSKNVYALKG